jgi:hypothetical protein
MDKPDPLSPYETKGNVGCLAGVMLILTFLVAFGLLTRIDKLDKRLQQVEQTRPVAHRP